MHHEHTPPPSTLTHTIKCYHNIQPPHTPQFFIAIKTVYHTIVSLICYCMYTNHSYCRFHSGYTIYLFNLYLTPESARKRANAFKLKHPGDDSVNSMTKEKMRMIKDIYRERRECVNNSIVITRALDPKWRMWIVSCSSSTQDSGGRQGFPLLCVNRKFPAEPSGFGV